jgi:hypothetical protein
MRSIEYPRLRGNRARRPKSAKASRVLGSEYRLLLDFAAAIDWRGAYKNAVAVTRPPYSLQRPAAFCACSCAT